jgi:hypothetical protein
MSSIDVLESSTQVLTYWVEPDTLLFQEWRVQALKGLISSVLAAAALCLQR